MPPSKGNYKNYPEESITSAIKSVRDGKSIRSSAKSYGIPEATLRSRLSLSGQPLIGHPTYFSPSEEEELANHCLKMMDAGYGYARWQVIELASNMALLTQKNVQPTKNWFYGVLGRFPELKMVKPKKREKSRHDSINSDVVSTYFNKLRATRGERDLLNKPGAIFNVDETGITLDHNPPKILSNVGADPYVVTNSRSATTTVIATGNALCECLPPYVIYKGERLTKELVSGGLPGTKYTTSATGWSNSQTFLDFFENHFVPNVTVRPCIILYDGHSTHITSQIVDRAKRENIHLFVLPPHSSHILQPLDVAVFSPFKKALSVECHKFFHANPGRIITRDDLPKLISCAYGSSMNVVNLMSAFSPGNVLTMFNATPLVSSKTSPVNRKERQDRRAVRVLFGEKYKPIDEANVNNNKTVTVNKTKKRKSVIPVGGTAITDDDFQEILKIKEFAKNPEVNVATKAKKVKLSDASVSSDCIGATTSKSKEKRKLNKNNSKGKQPAEGINPISMSNDNDIDDDEVDVSELCLICHKLQPPNFPKTTIKFVSWAQCDVCNKWMRLQYCTDVREVSENDRFVCPVCI